MCTAITYRPKNFYFGRTLDAAEFYPAEVVISPRGFDFGISDIARAARPIIGAAIVIGGFPLYFDGMNDCGLCMAGLNFVGNARFFPRREGRVNLAQYQLIPYILSACGSAAEAKREFGRINITPERFAPDMPPAELHWLVADKDCAFTAECTEDGMHIYENDIGVLTNNPPFSYHAHNLANYMSLSAAEPQNLFGGPALRPYGAGFGAIGLPGDFSSSSRFVRAAFMRANAPAGLTGENAVSQFFNILGSVNVTRGACRTPSGDFYTQYSCCMDATEGVYYIATHACRSLTAVKLLQGEEGLIRYSVRRKECILKLNF